MTRIVLFEDHQFTGFGPLIYWRTVPELLCGRRTLMDRAAHTFEQPIAGLWTRDWIADQAAQHCQVPVNAAASDGTVLVNGRWVVKESVEFQPPPFVGTVDGSVAYVACDARLAGRLNPAVLLDAQRTAEVLEGVPWDEVEARLACYPWDLIALNGEALEEDWNSGSRGIEGYISSSAVLVDIARITVKHDASIAPTAFLDASTGPVHISYNAKIESHVTIQGPAYVGPGTLIRPHSHIHGGTSIGPFCKVGGEVDATIICGYSNKQHTGFLGHAYLGSWINLGAGTTNSDLKNTYGNVRMRLAGKDVDTGQRFVGAVIGDHTKIGINQTIPTGTSIGFAANVFTAHVVPKFVPSFAWLTDDGLSQGDPQRLLETARVVMRRRNVEPCKEAEALFLQIFERAKTLEG